MVLLESVISFISANSTLVGLVCLTLTFIYLLNKILNKLMITSNSPNPFAKDTRRPPQPLETDHAVKDKVLKQGFTAQKIPEGLDAIVIGSGMGGLTTASVLSRIGKKVLVLEQHDQAGGCCHIFREKGYEFDVGIHYIGEMTNNTISKVFIDQLTDGQLQWYPLDETFDTVVIGQEGKQRQYPIKAGPKDQYRRALLESFPGEEKAINKFMKLLRTVKRQSLIAGAMKLIPRNVCNFLIQYGIINFISSFYSYAHRSLKEVLDDLTDNEDLKAVLSYNFGDYGTPPSKSSFVMHCLLVNHFMKGTFFPVGGASEIAYHIIPTIERSGGKVLVRAPVTQILLDSKGKACGVRVKKTSGDIDIHAPMIISAAGVYNTFQRLLPPTNPVVQKPIEKRHTGVQHGVGAMSVFVGLKGTKEELGLPAGQVWAFTGSDHDKNMEEYMNRSAEESGKDDIPLLFITFPSAKDPSWPERYPGKSTCTMVTLANWEWFSKWENGRTGKRGEEYDRIKDAIGEKMWEQCLNLYPQLRDKVDYFSVGSPVTNKYYIEAMKGEIYGLDHNKERFSTQTWHTLRPETDIPNLYLTGQDVMTCGFVGAAFSGLISCSKILSRNLMADVVALRKRIIQQK
ncbi:putative all-trans-retinol 13,14-reductase [Acanthaster planci]|uniref:All-trans-retinol 13,14-reductase n=1 Tax=Acanthaster planci TaxID=133434 RepID=A0A8B7XX37_ACAPL|nr:putative all-trans-retinol 13,14-reductase [Acanthaster planci]